ncbi:kinase-like protein [Coniophora puteana RWD-64-598 SS2]|uniref:Kinase-like protein n=1 Tax=Coniophora puteana (strain RWD-64-598) TaxID=741705 RepID=A0A5M3N574_CONPW|nr:kinase-like protein [Coniophora puteana RWD-64-598 SS2]EIW86214.1 kinase-like protein [Coniophora puteana RWD-64-598 SS2]
MSREGTLPAERARFYACEMIQGLKALHEAKITHGNLKPDNILFNTFGHVVISGFGSNTKTLPSSPSTTGETTKSMLYQAPEQLLGWSHDTHVDCWSFGEVLFTMLFGCVSAEGCFIHHGWLIA